MMQTEGSIILARYGACCVIGLSGVETTSVVSTPHGDRLKVLHHQQAEGIRLNGIDCPEKGQAYGNNARHAASALTFGKEVTVQTHGHDKYGRTIGEVILPDGKNLNQELVRQGWCWWYRKYAPGDTVLEGLEHEAREAKKGGRSAARAAVEVAEEVSEAVGQSSSKILSTSRCGNFVACLICLKATRRVVDFTQ